MKSITRNTIVVPFSDCDTWSSYVTRSHKYDFYHTADYHEIAKKGEPLLFVYEEDNNFIAFPFLKRPIPNTNLYDFHSVYGYNGPISNVEIDELNEEFIEQFQLALKEFLKEEKCVSVFAKFHPFFNQTRSLESMGGVHNNGKTVYIDLRQSLEDQHKKYRSSTYKCIKKARKLGYSSRLMEDSKEIGLFTALYQKSMDRIGATSSYKFDEEYFTKLLNSKQCNAKLLLILFEEKIICGGIITFNSGIIQAHLLATDSNYLNHSPAKLLIEEICLLGREYSMDYFHLGGGLGYKDNSLLDWKLGFTDLILPQKSWRYVFDEKVYADLVLQSGNDLNSDVDFFPLYRLESK